MKKILISALCLAAMWSCSTDDPATPENQAGDMYMQLSLKMETKSSTDGEGDTNSNATPDKEVGKDYENKVSAVDVVLYDGTNYVLADNVVPAQAATDTYVASFNTLALKPSTKYEVYIYANCQANATGLNVDEISDATVASITAKNNFWMTNAEVAQEITLPSDLSLYTQPQTPLNLGTHKVERSMARFDYMAVNSGNIYTVGKDANGTTTVNVTLTDAAVINQSKAFYMFRRVSADGTNTNWTVGGAETTTNYVVDTDYATKANGYDANQVNNFDAHMTAPATWTWKSLAGLSEDDNWDGTATNDHKPSSYKIMQYVKENTLPNVNAQEKGLTTAVVFKGQITATENAPEALRNAINAGTATIYVFNNTLYGTWEAVAAAAATNADATLTAAYNQVNAKGTAAVAADYAAAGFTGYTPVDGKYYTYYYYYNRHNDNLQPYTMGPMEFAVVRNNVYKLCVDNIVKFGHPTPGGNDPDPDPEKPEDPDESVNYYFNVTVKVLPWVVRVNHIEF